MNILFLSDPSSPHTIKWTTYLNDKGLEISIFGLNRCNDSVLNEYERRNISVYTARINDKLFTKNSIYLLKLRYLFYISRLRSIIRTINPDIVHAHYATSYGLLGALSGFHPLIISVWGSDVYDFPQKSVAHALLFKYILSCADKILSTSNIMKEESKRYTTKSIETTPFGVDTTIFAPHRGSLDNCDKKLIRIGAIKNLESAYGINDLINAFNLVITWHPSIPIKLIIVGNGTQKSSLINLVNNMKIEKKVTFIDRISYLEIANFHRSLSIYVNLSKSESFGVAVLEACACEVPVVVSNVGGLPEIIENGFNGFVVPSGNVKAAAKAIESLVLNKSLRLSIGKNGRDIVKQKYELANCIDQMMDIYRKILYR